MKTKNKHTKGPWKFNINKTALLALNKNNEHEFIYNASPYNFIEPSNADATLIATAPELYEMLDKINAAFYTRTSRKEWLELMEQTKPLLQKARGE